MQRATLSLLLVVLGGCGQPQVSPPGSGLPQVSGVVAGDPARLLLRYECEMGPVMEPDDRSCVGPTLSLYADGTAIYRDATKPWGQVRDVRIYPGYNAVVLTPAGGERLMQSAGPTIQAAAADPGTPPQPNEPIGDPIYWNNFDLADGAATLELRPGRGPLPRHGAVTAGLETLARQLGSWTPPLADRASAIAPYGAERGCVFVQRSRNVATAPWPWPDLTAAGLGLGAGPDATGTAAIDRAHLLDLIGDKGAWRGLVVAAPDGVGAAWLDVRALMPDETCPPDR